METFMGFISPFPWNWPPRNWTNCEGQLLPIAQYNALFALLGVTFGGDARNNFGIPDLRGRQIIGMGYGPGLTPRMVGEWFGAEYVTLTSNNLPAHTHTMTASNTDAEDLTQTPEAHWTLGAAATITGGRTPVTTPVQMYGPPDPDTPVQSAPSSIAGHNTPVGTMPPALCLNFCIALFGIFPSRN